MSTTPTEARTTPARPRDDLLLGSAEQDYILRIEQVPAEQKGDEARAAALTVCRELGRVYPDLPHEQVVTGARAILDQLGLPDLLRAPGRRTAQAA